MPDVTLLGFGTWTFREEGPGGVLEAETLHQGPCDEHWGNFHFHGRFTNNHGEVTRFVGQEGGRYPAKVLEELRDA